MIIGTGVDIIEVWRIKNALDKWGGRFLERVFTQKELDYASTKKFSHETLAARFACKESVLKAFGDTRIGARLKNIEILNDAKGKPEVILHGEVREFAEKNQLDNIIVSMSHTNNYAISNAILWRNAP
ncbi:MAG: holo-ACP synthase [Candidatus Omnitrophica bacterium]|nr:holo-ACP synthase [Candidatus Omnitrophota bacterium]MBU1932437.1 holo-ACP synthase [Candidatus Omnitrophota bacterium]